MTTTGAPARDQSFTNLAVQQSLVTKNLTISGNLYAKNLEIVPSVFSDINDAAVTSGTFQSSGGYFGNLISLQLAFTVAVLVPVNTGVEIATLSSSQAPLGNITGVALTSAFKAGTLLLDSSGALTLYATDAAIPAATQITGSVTYLV